MELGKLLAEQVLIVFVLISVGFILKKAKKIDVTGSRQLTNILLTLVTPCVLINAYQKEFKPELALNLLWGAIFSLLIHLIMIFLSTVIFRKEPTKKYLINRFTSIYSNCGFMAIPLLSAVLGEDGIFYGSAYLALFNIFTWTQGLSLFGGGFRNMSLKKAFINPGVIGVTISMVFLIGGITLPKVIIEPVRYIAGLNTPLAMIILGTYLANINIKETIRKFSILGVSFVRLILFPVIGIVLAKLMKLDDVVAYSVLITTACPSATIATLFAAQSGFDAEYASEIVSISTLLSILTIPLVMMLV